MPFADAQNLLRVRKIRGLPALLHGLRRLRVEIDGDRLILSQKPIEDIAL